MLTKELMQQIEEYVELRHTCGAPEYNVKTNQARKQVQSTVHKIQKQLDDIMMEYCPEEVSEEQWENWASHQKPISAETRATFEFISDPKNKCLFSVDAALKAFEHVKMKE